MSIPNDSFFFVVASNARKCGNHILVVSALNSMFCALKLTVKNRSAARKPSPQNPIYSTALKKKSYLPCGVFRKAYMENKVGCSPSPLHVSQITVQSTHTEKVAKVLYFIFISAKSWVERVDAECTSFKISYNSRFAGGTY